MTFPIAIEPNYGTSPDAGNAVMAWSIQASRSGKPYIMQDGSVFPGTSPCAGQWQDIPADQVPAAWAKAYPTESAPQQWVCSDPTQPGALIYQYASLYGRAGFDLWVLGAEAQAALDAARATIVPIPAPPAPPPAPAPVPVPVPPPPVGFWEYLAELRARFEAHF